MKTWIYEQCLYIIMVNSLSPMVVLSLNHPKRTLSLEGNWREPGGKLAWGREAVTGAPALQAVCFAL